MKLKTLKDILVSVAYGYEVTEHLQGIEKEIKKEVINWIKSDMKEQAPESRDEPSPFLLRWMKRLNITKKDLK